MSSAYWEDGVRCEDEFRTRLLPQGDQEPNRFGLEAFRSERKRLRGRAIEPLHVVDGDQDRLRTCDRAEHAEQSKRYPSLIHSPRSGCLEHQSRTQRMRLRRRELADRIELTGKQVTETRVRKFCLCLQRLGRDDRRAVRLRLLDADAPEGRLAGPRFS